MKVAFRVDAAVEIGTGHVMRCLTLADLLKAQGWSCCFVCRMHSGHLLEHIRQSGHEAIGLPSPGEKKALDFSGQRGKSNHVEWLGVDWRTDVEETREALRGFQYDWLIVDHYAIDDRWEDLMIQNSRRLMVIDDLVNRDHICDVLLDQNLHYDAEVRYRRRVPEHCRLLLGPSHALLEPAFDCSLGRERTGVIRSVFVYFGGNDVLNQAKCATDVLACFPDLEAEIVLGFNHLHRSSVYAAAEGHSKLCVKDFCQDMAGAMARADIGLGTCGVAALERCAMGLPSLVCVTADNQREDAVILHNVGAVENLGESQNVGGSCWTKALQHALADPVRISRMGNVASNVVAGHRANRLQLVKYLATNIY